MNKVRDNNLQGIIFMILSMGAFAFADTLIKLISSFLLPPQMMFFMVGGGLLVFSLVLIIQGDRFLDRRAFAPILLLRYLSEIIGMVGMVFALSYVPLSTVGAIIQATPLLVVVGAVLFLGEQVSWRRWSSIGVGFIGVLFIIQPGATKFDPTILFPVVSMFALSVRDLTTRLTPPGIASTSLATYTMAATLPFAMGWVFYSDLSLFPAEANWIMIISMFTLGSFGYLLLILSIRTAEVSVVSPFRYTRLIFLLITGVVVFDERPGIMILIGALLIVASGVYIMWRERHINENSN